MRLSKPELLLTSSSGTFITMGFEKDRRQNKERAEYMQKRVVHTENCESPSSSMTKNDRRLHRVNWCILAAIIGINLYVIITPFLPKAIYWKGQRSGKEAQLNKVLDNPPVYDNQLIVPAMLFNEPVFTGSQSESLSKGTWHVSHTSTPDKGSNTVIVGHRFTYTNPTGVFYNLDKVHTGDKIGLFWKGTQYDYIVRETKQVPPTAIEIEAPTTKPTLTLYTCTPLWSPKDRLVVIADLVTQDTLESHDE